MFGYSWKNCCVELYRIHVPSNTVSLPLIAPKCSQDWSLRWDQINFFRRVQEGISVYSDRVQTHTQFYYWMMYDLKLSFSNNLHCFLTFEIKWVLCKQLRLLLATLFLLWVNMICSESQRKTVHTDIIRWNKLFFKDLSDWINHVLSLMCRGQVGTRQVLFFFACWLHKWDYIIQEQKLHSEERAFTST